MLDQDKILNFLKVNGPVFPSKVAKNIKTEILLASAMLSDLASQGKVKISKLKVGGSPLYYLPGQEDQLYNFAQGNINPKDHQVLDKLKANMILREKDLDLLGKVALRSLKDFAVPLHVTVQGNKELFWKWHLLSDEETNSLIRSVLYGAAKKEAEPQPENKPETRQEIRSEKPDYESSSVQKVLVEETKDDTGGKDIKEFSGPSADEAEENAVEEFKKNHSDKDIGQPNEGVQVREEEFEKTVELTKDAEEEHVEQPREKIKYDKKVKVRKKKLPVQDGFVQVLEKYFKDNEIGIEEKEIVRKSSEIDLLVKVSSVVGEITYFCKAKNKSRCDEKDLSSAYMEAQIKKLPLLFLYKKEMTKKAKEMLDSGAFRNVIIKKFEQF